LAAALWLGSSINLSGEFMFKRTKVSAAAALLLGAVTAQPVLAQEAQRIEITGSAIKRIDAEGSLPVTVLRREDIERSGATSVVDLIQRLPGMQGATTEAAAVGGGGGGFSGASIHNLGETRTLVLLNGRRLTQFGGQSLTGFGSAVDLNTLPLSAIDRVEVLSDGASALYGSDAVAGVVNFITRRDAQDGAVSAGYSNPRGKGAEEKRFSISKGFGDLDKNGFNVFLAFGADERKPLNATQALTGKSGVVNFSNNGKNYQAFLGSPRGIPANTTDDAGDLVSPYFLANGRCATGNVPSFDPDTGKTACFYDFVAALEVFPKRERQNFMATADFKLGANHTLFADLLVARTKSTGITAPVPGELLIEAGSPLFTQYLTPISGTNGSVFTQDSTASYRVADLGRRTDINKSDLKSGVVGARGAFGTIDYEGGLSYSKNTFKNDISGYPGALAFRRLLNTGLLNPFVEVGNQSPEALAEINKAVYKGYWDGGVSELASADFRISTPLASLSGGQMAMAAGVNFYNEKFQGKPSPFSQAKLADPVTGTLCDPLAPDGAPLQCDQRFGDAAKFIPYSADRNVGGIFFELNAPVTKTLELTGSLRYDHYDEIGGTTNGKVSFKWKPASTLAIRGSVGTGFKAPTVPQLKATEQSFGVTSAPYDCTADLQAIATSLSSICRPNGTQYDVVGGGNSLLKPEKSRQASLGLLFEPLPAVSLTADLWWIQIRDAFGQIAEDEAFLNPNNYPDLWTTFNDIATRNTYVAYKQANLNLGKVFTSGIDLTATGRTDTPIGKLTTQLRTTYMIREKQQLTPGGAYYSAIGVNQANLGVVTFRWQGTASASLRTGDWTNSVAVNFKSGYRDAVANVELLNPDGTGSGTFEDTQLRIGRWETVDFQTQWQATKNFSLTAGVLNLMNKKPPLSLAEGGTGKGQMFGYDDRYYDVRGRTLYLNASLAF
jgi:iron complex outermembrane recepter protein